MNEIFQQLVNGLALGAVYVLVWLLTPINLMARDWVLSITDRFGNEQMLKGDATLVK